MLFNNLLGVPGRNVSTERYNVYTPSAVAAGMLLHTNNKFTMETVK
jgi:hypothetical protein